MSNSENHLNVFSNRSELHLVGSNVIVFPEGPQSEETKKRYGKIVQTFEAGFLEKALRESTTGKHDASQLPQWVRDKLTVMVDSISSGSGRALVGLMFLQIAIKAIAPKQSIRLHKGGTGGSDFSWVDGISMRRLDSSYSAPFLRDHHLLEINRDGVMMTRTLAENYPYTQLYKARIAGPSDEWMELVDGLESGAFNSSLALSFLLSALKNRSEMFAVLADSTVALADRLPNLDITTATDALAVFVSRTDYSARAFEVAMHSLFQVLADEGALLGKLSPLSQMRSANKKAGNIGDVEVLSPGGEILESWDAKFGKSYLWDELEELGEKLHEKSSVLLAGFVTDGKPALPNDLVNRKNQISRETGVRIEILSFAEWVRLKCGNLSDTQRKTIPNKWLKSVAESFGRKRLAMAPIDEPCDVWLSDCSKMLKSLSHK